MNNRFWWMWFVCITFLLTWGVLYIGYMVDDRVYDTVVVFVQAILLTFLSLLVVVLFVPRDRAGNANAEDVGEDADFEPHRLDPVLSSEPIRSSHHMDLRGLTITLLEMMALSERYDRQLTLVLMAVDDVDIIRSEYGDRASQRVMEEVADILSDALRIPDRSGVFSDNRFLVILPETDVDSGRQIAERVRRQIVDTDVRIDARRRISTTVSAGVTGFQRGDDPQAILDRVEAALAEAQILGSNHSMVWIPPEGEDELIDGVDDEVDTSMDLNIDKPAKLH